METMNMNQGFEHIMSPVSYDSPPEAPSPKEKPQGPLLACLGCRPRKIKCQRDENGCRRCRRLNIPCVVPNDDERKRRYSKKYISGLQERIEMLESALLAARNETATATAQATSINIPAASATIPIASGLISPNLEPVEIGDPSASLPYNFCPEPPTMPDNIISRLCGRQSQFNNDEIGQIRFFGPTSSLHVTESVSSSIFQHCDNSVGVGKIFQSSVPPALQEYLLDLYWTYQHNVLPVVCKEAFLRDMKRGRGQYFSKCLLYCIFISATRSSERHELRALSLPLEDGEQPLLVKQALALLDDELKARIPGITAIQSLLLLSVLDCAASRDTKGWLRTGVACRLAIDMGLHIDGSLLGSVKISPMDQKVRQLVFWSCFGFDRLWSMYLGRPTAINLADVTVARISPCSSSSWEMNTFAAWVNLLEIGGRICNALNGTSVPDMQFTDALTEKLKDWNSQQLESLLQGTSPRAPAVYHLQIAYCAFMILVHRPGAGFGIATCDATNSRIISRATCVEHSIQMTLHIQDYQREHGSASKMLGSASYNISLAATTLLANLAEQKSTGPVREYTSLTTCLKALKEMEDTESIARRVRGIIQSAMRIYNLHSQAEDKTILEDAAEMVARQNNGLARNKVADVQYPDAGTNADVCNFNNSALEGLMFPYSLENMFQMDVNLDEMFPLN